MCPIVTSPVEEQCRSLHLPLASGGWGGRRGLGREAPAALLRVRTGPECPEGNLRELTWASKPDCGIGTA